MTEAEKREMLGMAAKAAGVRYDPELSKPHPTSGAFWGLWLLYDREPTEHDRRHWNPLTDDGDALRLAVRLNLHLRPLSFLCPDAHEIVVGVADWDGLSEKANGDPYAATRLAITKAAAEIGRQMQSADGNKEGTR